MCKCSQYLRVAEDMVAQLVSDAERIKMMQQSFYTRVCPVTRLLAPALLCLQYNTIQYIILYYNIT